MVIHSLTLTSDLANLPRARDFVRQAAEEGGFSDERLFDITVACSEATANAIEHSPPSSSVELRTLLHGDRLEVQVEGAGHFEIRHAGEERRHRGLGLPLMATLADHLSLSGRPGGGTLVALSFNLPAPLPTGHGPAVGPTSAPRYGHLVTKALGSPWLRSPRAARRLADWVFWAIVIEAVVLVVVFGVLYAIWGTGKVVGESTWYIPLMHGFAALASGSVGFLALGRYRVLRDHSSYWIGVAFTSYAVAVVFFILTWPGLRAGGRSVVAELPSTSARIAFLSLAGLAVPLLVGVLVRRPGHKPLQGWRLFWLVAVWPLATAALSILLVLFERRLPALVGPEGAFNVTAIVVAAAVLLLFVAGAALAARGYLRTGDSLLAYAAMSQLAAGALVATILIGTKRYDVWYYFGRIPLVVGFLAVMSGLLAEYVRLFRREWEKAEELSLAQTQLRESEQRLRMMANAIPQLAWLAHPDGRIYWYNDRWYEYTGTTPTQMEGAGWQSVLNPETFLQGQERWTRSIATGQPFEMEIPMRGADGVYRPFLTRVMPVRNAAGALIQWVGTNTDVSESARLRAELGQELRTTKLLLEIADALAEWTDLRHVLQGLTEAVVAATGHTRATFALWHEGRQEVRVVASTGREPIAPFAAPLSAFSPPFQSVADTLRPAVADYDALPADQKRMADSAHSHKGLLVPMTYRRRLVGGLLVDDPGERKEFPRDEIRLVEGIAAQAAVAVENAQLYEAQSNIAATLQQALLKLPSDIPGLRFAHLYRSATEAAAIGGDFYDLIELDDDGYILLIGDVSGHGIEAARSATFVRDAVVVFAREGRDPQEMLKEVNQALLRWGTSSFVTILLATLSPDRRSISYCSAGHPHFIVRRPDGQTAVAGDAYQFPLGVVADWSCTVESQDLSPGDRLLFYTDGVIEARREKQLFGEARLARWMAQQGGGPIDELPAALLAEVLAFSGGDLRDDVAIMAVEIES